MLEKANKLVFSKEKREEKISKAISRGISEKEAEISVHHEISLFMDVLKYELIKNCHTFKLKIIKNMLMWDIASLDYNASMNERQLLLIKVDEYFKKIYSVAPGYPEIENIVTKINKMRVQ